MVRQSLQTSFSEALCRNVVLQLIRVRFSLIIMTIVCYRENLFSPSARPPELEGRGGRLCTLLFVMPTTGKTVVLLIAHSKSYTRKGCYLVIVVTNWKSARFRGVVLTISIQCEADYEFVPTFYQ